MSKVWVAVIAGAAGIGVGLLIARQYARATVTSDIHDVLATFGLGGGKIESAAQAFIVPQVVS